MFIAVRRNLLSTTAQGSAFGPVAHGETGLNPPFSAAHERCELRPPEAFPHLMDLPPEEAAAGLRGVWWDTLYNAWRTDFPPPPDFTALVSTVAFQGFPCYMFEPVGDAPALLQCVAYLAVRLHCQVFNKRGLRSKVSE